MSEGLDAADVLAIHDLLFRYCKHSDDGNFAEFAELLADADLFAQGKLVASKDPAFIRERFSATPRPEGCGRRHVTTNIIVEADGAGGASVTSYFVYTETLAGGQPRILQCGVYDDKFGKRDGAWRFIERRIAIDGAA
jgi:3-phenylpropionate/cinnamic acid dioxygenase small subunit